MKKIRPPECIQCGNAAEHESETWPSLKLCFFCLRATAQYMIEQWRLGDGHPILLELIEGLESTRDGKSRVWLKVPSSSSVFREVWISHVQAKSNPETTL